MNRLKYPLVLLAIFGLAFLGGCVKRNLNVRSDPPGATVYFNERELGETPLDFDFMYYAAHRIRIEKEGYAPIEELVSIRTPPNLWIPLDLLFELIPHEFWDRRELSYTLTPQREE